MENKFYTLAEIAKMFKISLPQAYKLAARGEEFKCIKIGGCIRVTEEDLQDYLASKTHTCM